MKSTDLGGGTPLWSDQAKNTKSMKIWRYFIIFPSEPIFSLIERIFWPHDCYSITTWPKNFISEVSRDFWYHFEILALKIFKNLKFLNFAWSLQRGGYLPPRSVDFTKRVRKSHFQIEWMWFKKSHRKILFLRKVITFFKRELFGLQKSSWALEITS